MRVHRSRVTGWLWVGLTALTATTMHFAVAEKPEARPLRVAPDPDGEPWEILPVIAFAGTEAGCPTFGNFSRTFGSNTPMRYRGDEFRVDFDGVVLREIRMQLRILSSVSTTLWFSVHQRVLVNDVPTYRRILTNDVQITALGNGTPTYYSTSPTVADLNLPLPPYYCSGGSNDGLPCTNSGDCPGGKCRGDYAIGAAWSSTAVTFARDDLNVSDGLPFLHGAALARLSINEAPLRPGDIAEVDLAPSTLGLWSMQLCFDAVNGACCVPNTPPDDCVETLGDDCDEIGGFFSGERTDCATGGANCVFGACCDECGVCDPKVVHTPISCNKIGGVWAGPGVPCVNNLCEAATGACCTGTTCTPDVCREECEDCVTGHCGVYLGDRSSCDPNLCSGACCVAGLGCVDVTREACTIIPGVFKGEGRSCAALAQLSTPQQNFECGGACCHVLLGQTRCSSVQRRSLCSTQVGLVEPTYMGDASVCRTNPEDPDTNTCAPSTLVRGACCFPDGTCAITDDNDSACPPGSFAQGGACSPTSCETCCTPGPSPEEPPRCSRTLVVGGVGACGFLGGVPDGADSCIPQPCDDVFGACCFLDRCEDDFSGDECETEGGRFTEGQTCGVACASPLGACCRPNGNCSDLATATECASFGGSFRQGQSCTSVNPACPAFGACCSATGGCSLVLADECEAPAGYFAGPNTLCGTSTCVTGACCVEDACSEILEAACTAQTGDYRGDGTTCDSSTIVCGTTPGACCFTDGQCDDQLVPQECLDSDGVFSGSNTVCTPGESCLFGACCLSDGTCEERLDFRCVPPEGCFAGPSTVCQNSCVPVVGDCTCDGLVDLADYSDLATCLDQGGPQTSASAACACADLDRDGDVDLRDVSEFWSLFAAP